MEIWNPNKYAGNLISCVITIKAQSSPCAQVRTFTDVGHEIYRDGLSGKKSKTENGKTSKICFVHPSRDFPICDVGFIVLAVYLRPLMECIRATIAITRGINDVDVFDFCLPKFDHTPIAFLLDFRIRVTESFVTELLML